MAEKNPVLVMGYLVGHRLADSPPADAYLQHEAWRRVWVQHTLETLRTPLTDEFQGLNAIKEYEKAILDGFDGVE